MVYKTKKTSAKATLSAAMEEYSFQEALDQAMEDGAEIHIAVAEEFTVLEQEKEAKHFKINNAGTVIYYFDNIKVEKDESGYESEKDHANLYKITVNKNGKVGKAEVYDSDVYRYDVYFVGESDTIYYCKDYKSVQDGAAYTFTLFVDKTEIGSDVSYFEIYEDQKQIAYMTDYDADKDEGTLMLYQGKKAKKVADEVHSFTLNPDGKLLYLTDYSDTKYEGDLYVWNGSKGKKIDEDVVCIIPVRRIEK